MDKTIIWAVGDSNGGPVGLQIAHLVTIDNPHKFVYLGDVYESGQISEYQQKYDTAFGSLKTITTAVPGNHDWISNLVGFRYYWGQHISLWSFLDIPGWRLFFLDSESPHDVGSLQYNFVQENETKTNIALFFHRHRYSAGGHYDQPDVQPFIDAVNRPCLVVSGHTHSMQRFKPVNGVIQLVAGCGGRDQYSVDSSDHRLAFGSNSFGACRLAFFDDHVKHRFVDLNGKILDEASFCP